MKLQVLSTGSIGNCYILSAGDDTLLLDAGVSITRIIREVPNFRGMIACLITHEHGDHAKAAIALAGLGVRIITSGGTAEALGMDGGIYKAQIIKPSEPLKIGNFEVMAFDTQHDAAEPFGFLVRYTPTGETLMYATDTYYLAHTFPGVHYWLVECNYLDEILDDQALEGDMSGRLRNRLKKSHMSLRRLLDSLKENDLTSTRKIVLVHLSDSRSNEKVMIKAIEKATGIEVEAADAGKVINLELAPF